MPDHSDLWVQNLSKNAYTRWASWSYNQNSPKLGQRRCFLCTLCSIWIDGGTLEIEESSQASPEAELFFNQSNWGCCHASTEVRLCACPGKVCDCAHAAWRLWSLTGWERETLGTEESICRSLPLCLEVVGPCSFAIWISPEASTGVISQVHPKLVSR